jgi:plasmid stabilization system protein ParE
VSDFVLTQAAKGDLLKILEYLEGDNPSAVLKVVDALDDAMQLLADNPGTVAARCQETLRAQATCLDVHASAFGPAG